MTPCVVYMRVSSDEQAKAGYSIPHQRKRICEYAARNGFAIVETFDEAHSARETGRPEFERMLRAIRERTDGCRTILVHKQDRIARNLTDWANLVERLHLHVVCIEEPVGDTPMGMLTQTFGAAMAKFYSDNLSQEVLKGHRAKFEAGGFNTRAPIGYQNISRTRTEKARVDIHPVTGPVVRLMFERYATGKVSLAALAEELFDLGLRTKRGLAYSPERVRGLLRHPFYRGATVYQGVERPGLHEALIPEPLWHDVQRTLADRHQNHGEKGSKFFLLRGLLVCGACDHHWTAADQKRGS